MSSIEALGPDGTVRLGAYLPVADAHWFALICGGCGHIAPFGVSAAVARLGPYATVGELGRRARCSHCGRRGVRVQLSADTRPDWRQREEGPLPETRAGTV